MSHTRRALRLGTPVEARAAAAALVRAFSLAVSLVHLAISLVRLAVRLVVDLLVCGVCGCVWLLGRDLFGIVDVHLETFGIGLSEDAMPCSDYKHPREISGALLCVPSSCESAIALVCV
jgi:hypothetical protein